MYESITVRRFGHAPYKIFRGSTFTAGEIDTGIVVLDDLVGEVKVC